MVVIILSRFLIKSVTVTWRESHSVSVTFKACVSTYCDNINVLVNKCMKSILR